MMKKVIHLSISNNKRDLGVWEAGIRLAMVSATYLHPHTENSYNSPQTVHTGPAGCVCRYWHSSKNLWREYRYIYVHTYTGVGIHGHIALTLPIQYCGYVHTFAVLEAC